MSESSWTVGNKYYLELRLFGEFAAASLSTPLVFRSDKVRALLAYLVIHSTQVVPRNELVNLLYSEYPEQTGRKNLNLTLTRLRQSLAPVQNQMGDHFPLLTVEREYVRLNWQAEWHWADVLEFDGLQTDAEYHPHISRERCAQCLSRFQRMAQLYTGAFLSDLHFADAPTFDEWCLWQQETRLQQVMGALFTLAESALAAANPAEALPYARAQLHLIPWQERAHRQLIQGLLALGEKAAARTQFATLKHLLEEKFHLEPSPETAALLTKGKTATRSTPLPDPSAETQADLLPDLRSLLLDPVNRLITLLNLAETDRVRMIQVLGQHLVTQFPDGIWFVSLVDCDEERPETIALTIAAALDIQLADSQPSALTPQTAILNYLRPRRLLLILNPFTPFIRPTAPADGVTLVMDILREAPQVTLLVLSSRPLQLQQEIVYHL